MYSSIVASFLKSSKIPTLNLVMRQILRPLVSMTHDDQSMGQMKFEKASDGSWVRKGERTQAHAQA